ncbi:hypothetical protein X943_002488 [Babesia divergens]|uniref:BOS complex subunit NCLN n=1 Tax=Babesia divergens TaxID=32595 RepID=A0AAD9LL54_BABDI|nr:hypothetical protein X943_002488 [Babesia divergens]
MKGALCVVSLFLAYIPVFSKASTNLEVHALSGFKIADTAYGFPGTMYYGRLLQVRALLPDLSRRSEDMSDADLDEALGRRLQKNGHTLIFRLDSILKNRFDFLAFRNMLNTSGSTALIVIPPPSRILPGSAEGCTEAPMLELDSQNKQTVCKHDPSTFHQSTMDLFHTFLMGGGFKGLVAVIEENDDALDLIRRSGEGGGWLGSMIRYSVQSPSYKKISTYSCFNIVGTLKGTQELPNSDSTPEPNSKHRQLKGQEAASKPKIVICSYFDTFSLLQSYRTAASNNTGLIAVLELARLLEGMDQQRYEVVILLTSGSIFNFHGASVFANSYSDIDNVELVLCLDDLTSPELYIHESSKATDISQLFQLYLSGSVTETVKRGISTKAKAMSFQHEQFTRQKVHSLTLTSSKDSRPMAIRQRAFEYKFSNAILADHIMEIAQSLAKALQGKSLTIIESDLKNRIAEWEEKLAAPRCGLSRDLYKDDSVRMIVKYLRTHLANVTTQKVSRKAQGFEFYSNGSMATIFYTARPCLYDLIMLCSACIYLFVIWSLIQGSPTAAYDDIMKMFSDSHARNTQTAGANRPNTRQSTKYKIG